jgi:hypothetical protein
MGNLLNAIKSGKPNIRLNALKKITLQLDSGHLIKTGEVNNHIHTIYSFSPYSPAMAAYKAYNAGLSAIGIVDHDSVSGCREFLKACGIIGIASTVGFEIRVNVLNTAVEGRKINNPDSANIIYIAVHGIPHNAINRVNKFLKIIRSARNKRNVQMLNKLNNVIVKTGLKQVDYKEDVYNISMAGYGGSITERHILYALVKKIISKTGKGIKLIKFLSDYLEIDINITAKKFLDDENNPYYEYDLLGVLKASFLDKIYIQPDYNECISVFKAVDFANLINAIPAYAYLGDVKDSPTGDKKAEKFEDDFLEELMPELKRIGFKAITYMPPRNNIEQLRRVKKLCKENDFMEISGVDINSARQSFNCPEIKNPEFSNLIDSTWALIAHEKLASFKEKYALFSRNNPFKDKTLEQRIKIYSEIGRKIDNRNPKKVKRILTEMKY